MNDYRVIVTGSRLWRGLEVRSEIRRLQEIHGEALKIIVGDAREGADLLARGACRVLDVRYREYKADWRKYPRAAGFIRNREMAEAGADECIAFALLCEKARCAHRRPHYTHGTANCMEECVKRDIPVREGFG